MKESITTDSMVLQIGKNNPVNRNDEVKSIETMAFVSPVFTRIQKNAKRTISLHNYEGYFAWLE